MARHATRYLGRRPSPGVSRLPWRFRSPGLRVGGKVFAFLGFDGELIVKLPSDRANAFVDAGTAEKVVMGERTMREWIAFPALDDRAATLTQWREVAREAHRYVDALRRTS
ncbi:MmcQ/YjbR family DNA-binding protein [Actinomadura sp. KC345]|uniref:MmcQ/YjbR family DNA-binding protein n=1 Tax=Actinomadura sp. KC345 TaxID=2530371 RepID=UPI0010457D17|nr:MmcQ/YjbR family DNA-binding protein [Actinomadura sp. KC345]TDC42198.1 MmcQ/YjbR family DNA-binding protein [Actinomadura sp. KC345]